jgi:hypothetical protein
MWGVHLVVITFPVIDAWYYAEHGILDFMEGQYDSSIGSSLNLESIGEKSETTEVSK